MCIQRADIYCNYIFRNTPSQESIQRSSTLMTRNHEPMDPTQQLSWNRTVPHRHTWSIPTAPPREATLETQ